MIVQFVNRQNKIPVAAWRGLLRRVLPLALAETPWGRRQAVSRAEVSVTVIFTGPRAMRRINRETRQVDSLTDVLSFPLLEMTDGHLDRTLRPEDLDWTAAGRSIIPLGELVISPERLLAQAADIGQPPEREAAFLGTHGLLHLLGYDHDQPARERLMLRKQRRIMRLAGLDGKMEDPHE